MKAMRFIWLTVLAVLILVPNAHASFHLMQIEQVIGGVNGNTDVQAVQLRMRFGGQNQVQNSRLVVHDATGSNPVVLIAFPSSVANNAAGARVLAATPDFVNFTSPPLTPDFILANPIPPSYLAAGSLTFESNGGTIYWRLSWGGASYSGPGTGDITNDADGNFSPPFAGPLPAGGLDAVFFAGPHTALSTNNQNDYGVTPGAARFTNNSGATSEMAKPAGLVIDPGLDLFSTPAGASHQDFSLTPLPPGFFGPGSDPFVGVIEFEGLPIDPIGPPGNTDTIVERLTPAPMAGPGDTQTIQTEIIALSLVSTEPITVTFNGGNNPEDWLVQVCLSSAVPQQQGQMDITVGCDLSEGGTFRSQLPVQPKFIFTQVGPAALRQELDTGAIGAPPIQFQAEGHWMPTDPGFNVIQIPPGFQVDHDCSPLTPDVGPLPPTTNFFPGVRAAHCDSASCAGPPLFLKRMTFERSLLAQHGVLPAQRCTTDTDGDGICDDADNCAKRANPDQADQDDDGVGDKCDNCTRFNPCQEDVDGNRLGDLCEVLAVGDAPIGPQVLLGRPTPNPVSGVLSYTVRMPQAGKVRVQVFDVQGGLIETLVDQSLGAGEHSFAWNARAASFRSGVYYLRLAAGELRQARSFTFMR